MRRRAMTRMALAALGAATLLLAGCGGGSSSIVQAPTASPSPSASATPGTLTSARGIDFRDAAVLAPIVKHFGGGEVTPERVVYADLTGDHVEEAVAIVESGGTAGDLGAAVFTVQQGHAQLLGYVDRGGHITVTFGTAVAGLINVQQGVYAAGDPQCCPTQLRETVYQWNGEQFAVETEQVITNPNR